MYCARNCTHEDARVGGERGNMDGCFFSAYISAGTRLGKMVRGLINSVSGLLYQIRSSNFSAGGGVRNIRKSEVSDFGKDNREKSSKFRLNKTS